MKKINTPLILGVITITAYILGRSMFFPLILWTGYGVYKFHND